MSRYKTGWSSRSGGWMIHNSSSIRYTGIGSGVVLSRANAKKGTQEPKTFEEIRDDCSTKGKLWEDPDFPATDSSIYFKNPPSVWPGIKWMRPKEICSNPEMFVGGASRLDVNQGALGDCWLLAAVSCLATSDQMLHNVVPADQSFESNYAGIAGDEMKMKLKLELHSTIDKNACSTNWVVVERGRRTEVDS